jgi:hypothetical protein
MDITETMLDALKKATWEKSEGAEEKFVSHNPIDESLMQDMTGIYTDTLNTLGYKYDWTVFYSRVGGFYNIKAELWVEGVSRFYDTSTFDTDTLGLFIKDAEDVRENLINTISAFLESKGGGYGEFTKLLKDCYIGLYDNIRGVEDADGLTVRGQDHDEIIANLKEEHSDLWSAIREDIIDNLEGDDINDDFKESLAHEWIEDNPSDAMDYVTDNAYTGDIKNFVINWIDNNI